MSMGLTQWIRQQYGPDRRYKSGRQLSLAISGGKNPNAVYDIETRGNARIDTLRKLSETLEVPLPAILVCAGWLTPDDLGQTDDSLTAEEVELLRLYRETRPDLRRVIVAGLRAASAVPPDETSQT